MRCNAAVFHQRALQSAFKGPRPIMKTEWLHSLKTLLITTFARVYNVFFPSPGKMDVLSMRFPSFINALFGQLFFRSCFCSLTPGSSDTHRMGFCTCWTATNALNQNPSASKTARISSTWSSPVKRESMTKWWRVRILIKCGCGWEIWNCATILLLWSQWAWLFTCSPTFAVPQIWIQESRKLYSLFTSSM